MKVFFDSSVLVAAMVEDEPAHEACAAALVSARNGWAAVHSLLECFATLTGGRLGVQLAPAEAAQLIRANIYERLDLVSLTAAEYVGVLESSGPVGARGEAVCDLLLLAAARKIEAERILSLNVRHFTAFAPDLANVLATP